MYALSLPNLHRDIRGNPVFARVAAVEGIFLANMLTPDQTFLSENDLEFDPDAQQSSQFDSSASAVSHSHNTHNNHVDITLSSSPHVQTAITFNKGGEWLFLDAPKTDADGNPIFCAPDAQGAACKLHLHGIAGDSFGRFYSDERAPGLIIGTGSIGHYAGSGPVNTYLSRDGGLTWHEVFKGSHIYEFGDHGGIIVMAADSEPTDTLFFSWDEGATWEGVRFTTRPMVVQNIITEPDNTDVKFVVTGYVPSTSGSGEAGILVFIDFADLHTRECMGHMQPGAPESDYEWWTPHDSRLGGQCLMGHTTHILRRKQFAKCFNPLTRAQMSVAQGAVQHDCQCTEHDFACDYGFTRLIEDGPCVVDTVSGHYASLEAVLAESAKDCSADGFYHASRGYRKVPGNTCHGGEQWLPQRRACPRRVRFATILFLLLLVGGAAWGVVQLHKKYDLAQLAVDALDQLQGRKPYTLITSYDDLDRDDDAEDSLLGTAEDDSGLGVSGADASVDTFTQDQPLRKRELTPTTSTGSSYQSTVAMLSDSEADVADLSASASASAHGQGRSQANSHAVAVDASIGPLPAARASVTPVALPSLPKPPSADNTKDLFDLDDL
jgi:hypothetical protein